MLPEGVLESGKCALVRACGSFQHRVSHASAQQLHQSAVVVQPDAEAAGGLLGPPAVDHHHSEQDQQRLVERSRP
jgi:hypothetical protein